MKFVTVRIERNQPFFALAVAVVFAFLSQLQKPSFRPKLLTLHCEQRSGEIRFSTQVASPPLPRFCSCAVCSYRWFEMRAGF
jgi:hypothetical protein